MLTRWLTAMVCCQWRRSAVRSWFWLRSPLWTAHRGTIPGACRLRWPPWSGRAREGKLGRYGTSDARAAGGGDAAHGAWHSPMGDGLPRRHVGVHDVAMTAMVKDELSRV